MAKVSAAAAVAVGVSETLHVQIERPSSSGRSELTQEPDDVDPDLRSISPISTCGS